MLTPDMNQDAQDAYSVPSLWLTGGRERRMKVSFR
jgi:hypothetical protein